MRESNQQQDRDHFARCLSVAEHAPREFLWRVESRLWGRGDCESQPVLAAIDLVVVAYKRTL